MALQALIALLGLHLVDADLLALAVLDDVRGDDGAVDHGGAEDAAGLVYDGEDAVELDGGAGLGLELLLKDLSTVHYKPERIWRWSEIAAGETARG